MTIKEQVIKSLEINGINIEKDNDLSELNIFDDIDSLQFISFISDLEHELSIEIPDKFLDGGNFHNLKEFIDGIEEAMIGCMSE